MQMKGGDFNVSEESNDARKKGEKVHMRRKYRKMK